MGQNTFSLYHDAATAGQVVDRGYGTGRSIRGRYECSETLNFGRLIELHTDGKLRHPQGLTTSMKIVGGCMYNPSLPPTNAGVYGYVAGNDIVPLMRKGQMWLQYTGTAPTVEATPNVHHASDDTATNIQHRGKITGTATATTAGAEIQAGPEGLVVIKVDTTLGLALCEFNLPA